MINKRIKDYITKRHEESLHKMHSWKISVYGQDSIWLSIPKRMENLNEMVHWGALQTELLYRIQKHWGPTYIYIRFETLSASAYTEILSRENVEEIESPYKDKGYRIFLFPDCRDQKMLDKILSSAVIGAYTRTVFILDYCPKNWKEVMVGLFNVVLKIEDGHSVEEFKDELAGCKCLCVSYDDDLAIIKLDLDVDIFLEIASDIARKEGLELVITDERKG